MPMSTLKSIWLAGAVAMAPAPLHAAPQQAPLAQVVAAEDGMDGAALEQAKAKMQEEIDKAIAMVERVFEIDKLPPVEPARLTLAEQTTAALIPAGSLEKMLDNLYGKMFKAVMEQAGGTSDLMLSIKTGVETDTIAALDAGAKEEVADLFDPHRKAREERILKVVKPLISEVLHDLEAPMRKGMARAYARKFSATELGDMNGFFATPSGSAFAGEWMALQADPEVMIAMIKAVPPLIGKFIDRAPELEGEFKALPKERQLTEFNDTELASLAKLMKVDVATLKEHRDMWSSDAIEASDAHDHSDDAAFEADAGADAADDAAASFDPAYDRGNWSDADVRRVEDLETAYDNAALAAQEAADQAAANARKRLPPTSD